MTRISGKFRITAVFAAVCIIVSLFAVSAGAEADISATRHSVVCLEIGVENDTGDWFGLSSGSGFFVGDPKKNPEYLITNHHVIQQYIDGGKGERVPIAVDDEGNVTQPRDGIMGRMRIKVFFDSTTFIQASLVDSDNVKDIAILRLDEPTSLRAAIPLESPEDNIAGKSVYAVGYPDIAQNAFYNPTSALGEKDSTITKGAVSRLTNVRGSGVKVVQTDTNIAAGNSGGPLINDNGDVVGVCCGFVTFWNAQGVATDVFYAINVVEAMSLLDRNSISYTTGPVSEGIPMWVWIAGGGGLLLIIVIIIIIAAVSAGNRKKRAAQAAAAAAMAPPMQAPGMMPNGMPMQPMGQPMQQPVNMMPAGGQPHLQPGDSGYRIECLAGALAGQRIMVKMSGSAIFGRNSASCNVVLPETTPGVSSRHCEVWLENGLLYIRDLGSSHGTFLQPGIRINPNQPTPLKEGTIFWLGTEDQKFIITMKR